MEDASPTLTHQPLTGTAAFNTYVTRLLSERDEAAGRADRFVPMTTLWWAEGDQMLGRLAVRHRLTPAFEKAGGHIGYDVRPSARGQGHATAMLAAALPIARSLGITQALLTVDETDIASRRVIETNGGRFIDPVGEKHRYRVPTS
ncbi:GNAT family N-acetyltransferase [Streptomyces incarnatus]|uniref:GNAT family N-acetyltransferase n=1 Tax=Streptomyces incarnatus TaxID=665007 RepID=UPI000AA110F6|nr:GNAT family N-acetyltransferase [Streptomyces incarnatus]